MASFDRNRALEALGSEEFDVLVIGGGITGAGVALDAASRGLRTALVDKEDFASGTSSKSSKMVHGGIRYLQQREVGLVYESLAERQRLLDNAPHLVSPLPFLIPLFGRDGVVSKAVARSYSIALWLYDITGGIRIGTRHRRVTRDEALAHLPVLRVDRLVAGFLYFDARADDARLTLTILRSAALDHGAVVANYAPVRGLLIHGGRVRGAVVQPIGQDPVEVKSNIVVNATGVWASEVAALAKSSEAPPLRPAKGVHVTVPLDRFPTDIAAVIPVPKDRRSIFVVPWPEVGLVYLGTTDTEYEGPLDDPDCNPDDVAYILGAANSVTTAELTPADVTGVWAGLRPLLASRPAPDTKGTNGGDQSGGADVAVASDGAISERTADLSRRHRVGSSSNGLITVTGGKLTTYRKMAQDTVDRVVEALGGGRPRSVTTALRLRGAPFAGQQDAHTGLDGIAPRLRAHLWSRYGTEAQAVVALAKDDPSLLEPVIQGLPYVGAEVIYAASNEMAINLDDVLARRMRALLQDARATIAATPDVARLLGRVLGWSESEVSTQATAFSERATRELARAGLQPENGSKATEAEAPQAEDLKGEAPTRSGMATVSRNNP